MAGLFERFGREQVEACFQAILDKCRDIYRNELLPKIADGASNKVWIVPAEFQRALGRIGSQEDKEG